MQAFALNNGIEFHQLTPLLDLVAVSIASDIVPIMGENRILAYHGLRQLNSNPSIGLKAIIDVCGLAEREITMSDIVFKSDHVSMPPDASRMEKKLSTF